MINKKIKIIDDIVFELYNKVLAIDNELQIFTSFEKHTDNVDWFIKFEIDKQIDPIIISQINPYKFSILESSTIVYYSLQHIFLYMDKLMLVEYNNGLVAYEVEKLTNVLGKFLFHYTENFENKSLQLFEIDGVNKRLLKISNVLEYFAFFEYPEEFVTVKDYVAPNVMTNLENSEKIKRVISKKFYKLKKNNILNYCEIIISTVKKVFYFIEGYPKQYVDSVVLNDYQINLIHFSKIINN
jgi:hypothetical protein